MVEQRFKIGQKVKVKSFVEIRKTLNTDGEHKETGLAFVSYMFNFCRKQYKIQEFEGGEAILGGLMYDSETPFYFHLDWLEPVEGRVPW